MELAGRTGGGGLTEQGSPNGWKRLALIGLAWLGGGWAGGLLLKALEARGLLPPPLREKELLGWVPYFLAAAGTTAALLVMIELCSGLFVRLRRQGAWRWPVMVGIGLGAAASGVVLGLLIEQGLAPLGRAGPLARGRLFGWTPRWLLYGGLVLMGLVALSGLLGLLGRLGPPVDPAADPSQAQGDRQPVSSWKRFCAQVGAVGRWLHRAPAVVAAELLVASIPAMVLAVALHSVLAWMKALGRS